jgi:hypothetical protein
MPGESLTASLIADLAREVTTLGERIRGTGNYPITAKPSSRSALA